MSEILVSLAILGIVWAMTVPLLEKSRNVSGNRAILAETVDILYKTMQQGMIYEELIPNNFSKYFLEKINAVKVCPNNYRTQGCFTGALNDMLIAGPNPGVVLPSGAVILGLGNGYEVDGPSWGFPPSGIYVHRFLIDVNGDKTPNAIGDDQLILIMCYGEFICRDTKAPDEIGNSPGIFPGPGTITPYRPLSGVPFDGPKNATLFKSLAEK